MKTCLDQVRAVKTSQAGLDLVKQYEGLRLKAYRDSAGVWTCGYGHTRDVTSRTTCTEKEAEAWLRADLAEAEAAVARYTTARLTQAQFDALASFVFNLGSGAFSKSTLRKVVNAGEHPKAPEQFCRWVNAGGKPLLGLARRRVAEAALYLS